MASHDGQSQTTKRVIETASGTTSPDNARSGNIAYVIAAVVVLGLSVLGLGMRGCVSFVGDVAVHRIDSVDSFELEDPYGFDTEDDTLAPLEEDYLDEIFGGGSEEEESDTLAEELTVEEALDLDLSLYSSTIDASLAASDYANADKAVSSFVRELVLVDKNASGELGKTLRGVTFGQQETAEALAAASTKAAETAEELRQMALPEVDGEGAKDIARSLEVGRSKAIARWEAIGAELAVLDTTEAIVTSELTKADEDVENATVDAAEALSSALVTSANNR